MNFNPKQAQIISDSFRIAVKNRFNLEQRLEFERLLQISLGIKNLEDVQSWTQFRASQRDFISKELGEGEIDLRTMIAYLVSNLLRPNFPTKQITFRFPIADSEGRRFTEYLNDEYIKAYAIRLFPLGESLILEVSADDDIEYQTIDLDSPEFDDLFED